jgi:hypothetical protein
MSDNLCTIIIAGITYELPVSDLRAFASGSEGYNASGKIAISGVSYQVGLNVTRVGSKEEPEAEARKQEALDAKKQKNAVKSAKTAELAEALELKRKLDAGLITLAK